jgi:hypothetical protein
MRLIKEKKCSCGRIHTYVDEDYKYLTGDNPLAGFYWNCECKSTLFSPFHNVNLFESEPFIRST